MKKSYYYLLSSYFLAMSSMSYAAAEAKDSLLGKIIIFFIDMLGIIGQLILGIAAVAGVGFVLVGVLDKLRENRNEEGWIKKVVGGTACALIAGGLLGAILNDLGVKESGTQINVIDWSESSSSN